MNQKKIALLGVGLAVLLITLACNFSVSTANIKDAYLARNEGAEKTSVFKPDEVFYLIVDLGNAPDDTRTKAVWYAVSVPGLEANAKLDEAELIQGSGQLTFSLSSSGPWPAGTYKVELYLNDELNRTLEFQVEGPPPAPPTATAIPATATSAPVASTARLVDAFLALDAEGTQPTETFSPGDIFHLRVTVADSSQPVQVKSVWTVVQAAGIAPNTLVKELEGTLPQNGTFHFELSNDGPWPEGVYKVDIFLDGNYTRSLQLSVVANLAASGHPLLGTAFTSLDEDGRQPTQIYGANAKFYAIVELVGAPASTVVRAIWYATNAAGVAPNYYLDETEITSGSGRLVFDLSNSNAWPTGDYRVEIYINGVLAQVLNFQVR